MSSSYKLYKSHSPLCTWVNVSWQGTEPLQISMEISSSAGSVTVLLAPLSDTEAF